MNIPKSKRGGAREGAGRKTLDGTESLKPMLVTLDVQTVNKARAIGSNNLSEGIRRSVAAMPEPTDDRP